ncbi:hypothetical protein FJZ31_25560 [Candidatus Poribacteria bacterium]|nr:hypothetical protein [Candidatus Poribacteria bacterium]
MNWPSKREVWTLAERLMNSIFEAIRRIDELAPEFPGEWVEARDKTMEGLQVGDYMERLVIHSQQHRYELVSVRAAIGRSRPTDPGDTDPNTNELYARTWYQWRLLEAFLRRAEMVSELIGLNDEDLDRKPSPELVAGNERSIREVCEHVLRVQKWIMSGVEDGISAYRNQTFL